VSVIGLVIGFGALAEDSESQEHSRAHHSKKNEQDSEKDRHGHVIEHSR